MVSKKGKLLKLPLKAQDGHTRKGSANVLGLARPRLRSNEWLRLLSIQNKQKWEFPLNSLDQRDHEEIMAIQAGRLQPFRPEKGFLNAACTMFRGSRLCWIEDSETQPYRELTAQERVIWDVVGIKDLLGYLRPDGSIQPFVLSGWERIEQLLFQQEPD
ncbi:MAG: hypothetical protein ACOC43_09345 [Desulfohalobiaceae bacterium]